MSPDGGPGASETGLIALRPGPLATTQDRGRPGHRAKGVPLGGAFDLEALELANALVGNPPDAAALELTLLGGLFRAEAPLRLAFAGAPMGVRLRAANGQCRALRTPAAFELQAEDLLEVGGAAVGLRAYLAVAGGWRMPVVLGSRSSEDPIQPGQRIPASPSATPRPMRFLLDPSLGSRAQPSKYQPSLINPPPSTSSQQPSDINHQPSASSQQPSDISQQPSDINHQPSASSHQSSDISHQPSDINHQSSDISHQPSDISHQSSDIDGVVVRVLDGPDAALAVQPDWTESAYRVASDSDRVGLRLEGPAPRFEPDPARLSAPVIPGTVQATGETLIVLGPACGTMGGYPQIAHVLTVDLTRLAQLRPGDALRFQRVDLPTARDIDRAWRRERQTRLLRLRAALDAYPKEQ